MDPHDRGNHEAMRVPSSVFNQLPTYLVPVVILGLYWGYIGIMENKMETTIYGLGCILSLGLSLDLRPLTFWDSLIPLL